MNGYDTLVKVTEGDLFPRQLKRPCERCGEFIDTTNGNDMYTLFANVRTIENSDDPFESKEALITWCPICFNCSKHLAAFFKTNLSHRGKVVYEDDEIEEGKVGR